MPNTTMPTTEISPVQAAQAKTESKSTSSNSSSHINKITYLQRKTTEQGEVIEQKVAAEVTDEQLAIINRDTELVIQGVKAANQERLFSDGQGRMPKNKIGQIWNAVTHHLPGVFGRIGKDFTGHERAIIQGKIVEQVLARGESVSTQQITTGLADVAASVLRAKGIGGKDLFNKKQVDAARDRLKKSAQSEYANRQRAEQNVSAIVYGKIRKAAESNLKLADIKSKSPEEQLNWLKENVLRGVPDQIIDAVNPSAVIDEIAREKLQMDAQQEASSLQIDAINSRIKKVLDMAKATGLLNKDTEKWILENGVAKKFDWVVQKGGKALIGLGFATAGIVLTLSGLSPVAAVAAAIYHTALPILTSAWLARKGFDIHYQKARAGREADRAMIAGAEVNTDKKGLEARLLGMLGPSAYEAQSQEFLARRAGRGSYQSADILIKGGERTNIDGKKEKANSIQDLKDQLRTAVETNGNVEKALKDLADRASEIQELLFAGRLQLSDGQTAADILKQLGDIDIFVKLNAESSFSAYRNMVSNHATEVASNISSFKKAEKNDVRKAMIGGMTKQIVLTTAVYPLVGGVLGSLGTHAVMDLAGHGVSGFSHFNVDAQESLLTGAKAFDTSNPLFALNHLITGKGVAEDFLGNIGISQSVINAEQLQNAVSDILNGKTNANPELVFTLQHLSPSDQENFIASYQALGGYLQTGRIDLDGLNLGQKEWIAAQANDLLSQPGSLPPGTSTHLEALIHELGKVNPTKESNQLVAARMAFVTGANYDKVLTEINSQKVRAGEAATGTAVLNHAVDTQNGSEIPYTPGKPDASVNLENNAQPVDLPKNFNDWNTANSANGTYPNGYFTITKVDGSHAEIDFVDPSGHHIQVATDIHWDSQDHSKIDFLNSINGGGASASSGDVLGNYDHNLDGFYGSNHVTSNFADMIASEKDYTVMYNSLNLNEVVVINPTDNVYDFLNHPSNYDSIFSAIKNSANPGDYFLIQHNGSYYWGVLSRDGNLHLISANQIHSFSDLQNTQIGDSNISQGSFNELTKAGELVGGAGKNIEGNTVVSRSSFDLTNESIFTAATQSGGTSVNPLAKLFGEVGQFLDQHGGKTTDALIAGTAYTAGVSGSAELVRQRTLQPDVNGRVRPINKIARGVRNAGLPGLVNFIRYGNPQSKTNTNRVRQQAYNRTQAAEFFRGMKPKDLRKLYETLSSGGSKMPNRSLGDRLQIVNWAVGGYARRQVAKLLMGDQFNLSPELIGIAIHDWNSTNRGNAASFKTAAEKRAIPIAKLQSTLNLFPDGSGGKTTGVIFDSKGNITGGYLTTHPELVRYMNLDTSSYPSDSTYNHTARALIEGINANGGSTANLFTELAAATDEVGVMHALDKALPLPTAVNADSVEQLIKRTFELGNGTPPLTSEVAAGNILSQFFGLTKPAAAASNLEFLATVVDRLNAKASAGSPPSNKFSINEILNDLRNKGTVAKTPPATNGYKQIVLANEFADVLKANMTPETTLELANIVAEQAVEAVISAHPGTSATTDRVIDAAVPQLVNLLTLTPNPLTPNQLIKAVEHAVGHVNTELTLTPALTFELDSKINAAVKALNTALGLGYTLPGAGTPGGLSILALRAQWVVDAVENTTSLLTPEQKVKAALEANGLEELLTKHSPPNYAIAADAVLAAREAMLAIPTGGTTALMTVDEFNAGLRARVNQLETSTPPTLLLTDVHNLVKAVYDILPHTNLTERSEALKTAFSASGIEFATGVDYSTSPGVDKVNTLIGSVMDLLTVPVDIKEIAANMLDMSALNDTERQQVIEQTIEELVISVGITNEGKILEIVFAMNGITLASPKDQVAKIITLANAKLAALNTSGALTTPDRWSLFRNALNTYGFTAGANLDLLSEVMATIDKSATGSKYAEADLFTEFVTTPTEEELIRVTEALVKAGGRNGETIRDLAETQRTVIGSTPEFLASETFRLLGGHGIEETKVAILASGFTISDLDTGISHRDELFELVEKLNSEGSDPKDIRGIMQELFDVYPAQRVEIVFKHILGLTIDRIILSSTDPAEIDKAIKIALAAIGAKRGTPRVADLQTWIRDEFNVGKGYTTIPTFNLSALLTSII